MRTPRRPVPFARAGRALLVAAVGGAVVLVPATAWAGTTTTPDPVGAVTSAVQGALTGQQGQQSSSSAATQTQAQATQTQAQQTQAEQTQAKTTQAQPAQAAPTLPPLDLSQLNRLLTTLGVPASCATSVEGDLQQTVTDIPATAEQLLQQIVGKLSGGGLPTSPVALTDPATLEQVLMGAGTAHGTPVPTLSSSDPTELALVTDIQQLLTDLLTHCLPAASTTPPSTQAAAPAGTGQPPVVAQPVSYPGYAPTGGTGPAEDGPGPLAALGAGLVLAGGAGLVGYRVRSRAARAQD